MTIIRVLGLMTKEMVMVKWNLETETIIRDNFWMIRRVNRYFHITINNKKLIILDGVGKFYWEQL